MHFAGVVMCGHHADMGRMKRKVEKRNKAMMTLIERLKTRAAKAAEYRQTVAELSRLSRHDMLDLDIYHGDIPEIARKAVYGS